MKIGVISDKSFVISGVAKYNKDIIYLFTISLNDLSFYRIFHSAFATPARYVQEIYYRLRILSQNDGEREIFVFNPLLDGKRLYITVLLAALKRLPDHNRISILADRNGVPLGYFFPSWFRDADSHFLSLLSTIDARIDAQLCSKLFNSDVQIMPVAEVFLDRVQHNGFSYEENKRIYLWVAERNLQFINSWGRLDPTAFVQRRNSSPFTAIMPYHAGDVLFISLAWNFTENNFGRVVINKSYLDIPIDISPQLKIFSIDMPVINRGDDYQKGIVTPEHQYFESMKEKLPVDSFYYYCRPSRDYSASWFHLIDQFAFALGRHFHARDELLTNQKPMPALFKANIPAIPVKVILHFDGGWLLKVYPPHYQERLINLLQAKGYEITILASSSYVHPKCDVTTFITYEAFVDLIKSHHILVGMDSFPCHYAAHVHGLPTICLFSSTRPENSNAPGAFNYRYLENGFLCRPCDGIVTCPLQNKPYCENFINPETVVAEVDILLKSPTNKTPVKVSNSKLRSICVDSIPIAIEEHDRSVEDIHVSYLWTKPIFSILLIRSYPYICFFKEYTAAVDKEGFLIASIRAIRFFCRKVKHYWQYGQDSTG